jgi:hypothetical protein
MEKFAEMLQYFVRDARSRIQHLNGDGDSLNITCTSQLYFSLR